MWNGWKGQLLRTLYYETEPVLTGGHSQVSRDRRVAAAREELAEALADWPKREREAYLRRHYPAYWLRVDLPRKIAHADFIREADREKRALATAIRTRDFEAVTEITVFAPDHPRLLSIIAGACTIAGANIVDAQVYTTTDGQALDSISISREFDDNADEERRARKVGDLIEQALAGTLRLPEQVAQRTTKQPRLRAFSLETDVSVDNELSNLFTVVEASGLDRPGLLYDLTRTISDLNLNIASAHVSTFGERAVDVFYVTDLLGHKIANGARQAAIRRRLRRPSTAQAPARERARTAQGTGLTARTEHRSMSLLKNFATVGGATATSRILGFVRDIFVAAALGTGPVADAFFVAFRFPNLFRRLFAEGALQLRLRAALRPGAGGRGRGGGAGSSARRRCPMLLTSLLVVTAIAEIAMPILMFVMAPGFSAEPEKFDLTVFLTRIAFPYLGAGVAGRLLQRRAQFARPLRRRRLRPGAAQRRADRRADPGLLDGLGRPSRRRRWCSPSAPSSAASPSSALVMFASHRAGAVMRLRRPRLTPAVRRLIRARRAGRDRRRHHPDQHRHRHDDRLAGAGRGLLSLLCRPALPAAARHRRHRHRRGAAARPVAPAPRRPRRPRRRTARTGRSSSPWR